MASIQERFNSALTRLQQRQPQKAVRLLKGILRENPSHLDALELLGIVSLHQKQYGQAKELLERAVAIEPVSSKIHCNLGLAYKNLGRLDAAVTHYRRALKFAPRDAIAYYNLGNVQVAMGEHNEAGLSYQRAIRCKPDFIAPREKLANLLRDAGYFKAAVVEYGKLLEIMPDRADVYVDLGSALRGCKQDKQALVCFRKALEINPKSIAAMNNLSNTLRESGQVEEAEAWVRKALELRPHHPILHNTLGLALESLDRNEEAYACYEKALELKPDYTNGHYNLARMDRDFGNYDMAEAGYQRALQCDPNKAEAHYQLGGVWLARGDFARGWPEHEWRWEIDEVEDKRRAFPNPTWDGGSLEGKRILIYAEQGFGDTLQFVRYAKLLKQRGATVVFACQKRLRQLFSRCEGIDELVDRDGGQLPGHDVQSALLSLPGLCGTTLQTVPCDVPYLFPDPAKVDEWKDRLADSSVFRVGIAWQGSPTYLKDKIRSIPLNYFLPLSEVEGVQLISLQKGHGSEQLTQLTDCPVEDLGTQLDNAAGAFVDTAAVMQHLDLIISSDTSIAHLAGGLGVPVWVALNFSPDWRWMYDRRDNPWYPTLRLFRQPSRNDWEETFEAIRSELAELVQNRSRSCKPELAK